jgi:O-antigen/teichoic acid export membrane protein
MFLPAFASFRNEIDRLKKNFLKVSIGGGLLLIPFLLCLFFGAQSFVALTYGEKWASTVPIIRILIIYVMFDSLFLSDEAILIVMDKVRSVNMQRTFAFIMLSMIGYILINKFGLIGMAVALTLISIITIIAIKAILLKLLNIRPYEYLKSLAMVFKSALVLFALLYVYSFFIDGLHSPLIFITGEALIFTGFVAFVMFKYGLIDLSGKKIELNRLLQNNI